MINQISMQANNSAFLSQFERAALCCVEYLRGWHCSNNNPKPYWKCHTLCYSVYSIARYGVTIGECSCV